MKKVQAVLMTALCGISLTANAQKWVGGDISLLPTYEEHHVRYLGRDGNNKVIDDKLAYWTDSAKWNAMRVRLFVDPSKASAEDQGEGVRQNLAYVTQLAKRIKDHGCKLMLDYHYSDTWTDPGQHSTPASWQSNDPMVLADSVYEYTKRTLQHLVAHGAAPDFIQVGNEITAGMMWPTGSCYANGGDNKGTWSNLASYLKAGIRACNEVCPNAKTILHTEMHNATMVTDFYHTVAMRGDINYDIIALSYYPDYHGTISTLSNVLSKLENHYPDKQIMIVETGYGAQYALEGTYTQAVQKIWPVSEAGQKKFATDLIQELNRHHNVTGLFWWMPEDNEYYAPWPNYARQEWWNASLYNQSTGKPRDAMFVMQQFLEGSITAVEHLNSGRTSQDNRTYNLAGQRVGNSYRGIVIRNGRKVVQK
jgi:arabinogalactan endo-1,4-beta-galactosidase